VKLIIEASIGLAALLLEANTAKALQLRADVWKGIHEVLAPDLYLIEVGNVLIHAARVVKIPQADLPVLYGDLFYHQPLIYPSTALFPRAFQIASQIRVSVYDAIYLALSDQECRLRPWSSCSP
jgi:predicted nucleic acid-binding protein